MKPTLHQRQVDADHPWLGLQSFTEENQHFFFGRDAEIADIYLRTRENPLTILYGQSGLGKTSLLGAGLIPKLKHEGFRPLLLRLRYEKTDAPLIEQLKNAFATVLLSPGLDYCNDPRLSMWEILHHLASRPPDLAESPPVLIFDQFEEAFTLGQRAERSHEVRVLFTELADVIENRPPAELKQRFTEDRRLVRDYDLAPTSLRIVITLREDYLSHLEAWKRTLPSLMRNRMALHLLNGPQALDAVFKPGHLEGRHLVDEVTATRIVRFVANKRADVPLAEIDAVPPLLSLVCDELNNQRIEQRRDRITAERATVGHSAPDEDSGDLETRSRVILRRFYERSFSGFPAGVRHFIEDRMVTIVGHRCPVSRDDANAAFAKAKVKDPAEVLTTLVNRRLISTEERGGVQWFEITHDVLVPVIKESKDKRLARQRIRRMIFTSLGLLALLSVCSGVTLWALNKQRVTDEALKRADEALKQADNSLKLAEDERQKAVEEKTRAIEAEKKTEAAQKETERQLALVTEANQKITESRRREEGNLLEASNRIIDSLLLATFASEDERDPALVAYSKAALDLYPKNRLALFTSAVTTLGPNSGRGYLPEAIANIHSDGVVLDFSPDGRLLAVGDHQGKCLIFDSKTLVERETYPAPDGDIQRTNTIKFSPDGKLLARSCDYRTASTPAQTEGRERDQPSSHLEVFDLEKHESIFELQTTDLVWDVEFSAQADKVYVALAAKVMVLDARSGKVVQTLPFEASTRSFNVSPDGNWFAVAVPEKEFVLRPANSALKSRKTGLLWVRNAVFSPDGQSIALWVNNQEEKVNSLKVLDVKSLKERFNLNPFGSFGDVGYSSDGRYLMAGRGLFDAKTGLEVSHLFDGLIASRIDVSPDGCHVAVAGNCSGSDAVTQIRVFETEPTNPLGETTNVEHDFILHVADDGKSFEVCHGKPYKLPLGGETPDTSKLAVYRVVTGWEDEDAVHAIEFESVYLPPVISPDGRYLAVVEKEMIRLLDAETGAAIQTSTIVEELQSLTFDADSTVLMAGDSKGTWTILELPTLKLRQKIRFEDGWSIAKISPARDCVLLAHEASGKLKLMRADENRKEQVWEGHSNTRMNKVANTAVFSPNGALLAIAAHGELVLLDCKTGVESLPLGSLSNEVIELGNAIFNADSSRLIIINSGSGMIIDVVSNKIMPLFVSLSTSFTTARFSQNGSWLALGDSDKDEVRMVDMRWFLGTDEVATPEWRDFLAYSGGVKVHSNGLPTVISTKELIELKKRIQNAVQTGPTEGANNQRAILKWWLTPPEQRPETPWKTVPVWNEPKSRFGSSFNRLDLEASALCMPWHPLSLLKASFHHDFPKDGDDDMALASKRSHSVFVAKATLERLESADEAVYGNEALGVYAAWARLLWGLKNMSAEAAQAQEIANRRLGENHLIVDHVQLSYNRKPPLSINHRIREVLTLDCGKLYSKDREVTDIKAILATGLVKEVRVQLNPGTLPQAWTAVVFDIQLKSPQDGGPPLLPGPATESPALLPAPQFK